MRHFTNFEQKLFELNPIYYKEWAAIHSRAHQKNNWGAVMKRIKSQIMSKNPLISRLSLQLLSLLTLGISLLLTDVASAQQRGSGPQRDRHDDRPRGNRNQSGCFEGDGLHRVPCPFDNDVFYRPGSGDRADGSERWGRGDSRRINALCINPADRTPLMGDALRACIDGAKAASFFAEDVAGLIGEIEGYRYGYSYGMFDGANEATSLRDRLGRLLYADDLVSQGSSQYQNADQILRNPPIDAIGSMLVNQLQAARNVLSTDMGTTDGPNAAADQFESYTQDHNRPLPNIHIVDDRRNIPILNPAIDADPFGSRIGYTEFCAIVDRLDLDRQQGHNGRYAFNPYNQWDRNTVRHSFLDRLYFSDSDRRDRYQRPRDLCFGSGQFYPARKLSHLIIHRPSHPIDADPIGRSMISYRTRMGFGGSEWPDEAGYRQYPLQLSEASERQSTRQSAQVISTRTLTLLMKPS
jgi:hypothetical protein